MDTHNRIEELTAVLQERKYSSVDNWIETCDELLRLAREADNHSALMRAELERGYAMVMKGNYEEALQSTKAAVRTANKYGFRLEKGKSYNILGIIHARLSNEASAIDFFESAVNCFKDCKAYKELSNVYSNMVVLYFSIQDYEKVLQCQETAKYYMGMAGAYNEKQKRVFDTTRIINSALTYEKLGECEHAERCIKEAEAIDVSELVVDLKLYIAVAKIKVFYKQGRIEESLAVFDSVIGDGMERLANAEVLDDYFDIFDNLCELADFERAEALLAVIWETAGKNGSNSVMISVYKRALWLYERLRKTEKIEELIPDYCETLIRRNNELDRTSANNLRGYIELEQEIDLHMKQRDELTELEKMSTSDALTGLANRYYLNKYIESTYKKAVDKKKEFGIMILDVDEFKKCNDTLGHLAGDFYLMQAAKAIKSCAKDYFSARFGGDEFFIVAYDKTESELMQLADEIREKLVRVSGEDIRFKEADITVSMGIYNAPADENRSVSEYIHFADIALYSAKAKGGNTAEVYS